MARIVAEHYAPVYRFCARRIGDELAKDAAQETFLTAHRKLNRFDASSTLLTFLLGIANNQCRNMARKHRREMSFTEIWEGKSESNERSMIDREALRQAMTALSTDHREVIVMHELEGLTYDEIATVLGIPSGTVKSRLHHAFVQLRLRLVPAEEVPA